MARFVLILFAALLPSVALAKRAAPAEVEPIIFQGIRYIAPTGDGVRAYIEAWDVQANKKLWDLIVFTNRIDPTLEEDVQAVYIKTMRVQGASLLVTSERDKTYRVDLTSRAVTPAGWSNNALEATAAALFILIICVIFVRHRRRAMSASSGCASALDR
jgi:hypothetical protein